MKRTLCFLLCAALLLPAGLAAFAADGQMPGLAFNDAGEFKILHLTDTQDDHHPADDMVNFITEAIRREQPDLIVFTGDLVEDSRVGDRLTDDEPFREGVTVKSLDGSINHDATLSNIEAASDAVLSVFQASGIPFAIAQGNNDHKCGITNEEWLQIYSRYPGNLTVDQSPDAQGRIDYQLTVRGRSGGSAFRLWLMDTGRDAVSEESLAWYQREASRLTTENGGAPVPAFVFQHIQVPDVGNLFEPCRPTDDGARFRDGQWVRLNKEIACGNPFYGWVPCEPSAEFQAWKTQGDVIGAFFGHQHVEGFSGTVDGIALGFTYGCEFAKIGPYGYRVLTLREEEIRSFTNEVWQYTGSVKQGNWQFVKEEDAGYPVYDSALARAVSAVRNLAVNLISIVTGLFA